MSQTIIFEADADSSLTETEIQRIETVLEALREQNNEFEQVRFEVTSQSLFDSIFESERTDVEELSVEDVERSDSEENVQDGSSEERDTGDAELSVDEQREQIRDSDELPTVNPGTRRYTLASVLYHSDGYLTTAEIVELSQGEDWEVGQSPAAAELYNMFKDYVTHRRQRGGDGSYEYWLTDAGIAALEASDDSIEPDPFEG